MPLYLWLDKKTGKTVEVMRSFAEYEKPPMEEESPGTAEAEWERQIEGGQSVVKGQGWGSGKGYWVLLVGLISSALSAIERI